MAGAKDFLGITEHLKVEVFRSRPTGGWFEPEVIADECWGWEDLVTNVGRIYLAKRIGRTFLDVGSGMDWVAVGSGATAAALGNTVLVDERARKVTAISSAITNNIFTSVATFGGAEDTLTNVPLQEAGLFNSPLSAQGILFQRVTFATVTLTASDIFKITMETVVGSNTI